MTVYGLLTEKTSLQMPKFVNRYWVQADSLGDVQVIAGTIIDAEQIMFGTGVRWTNTHVWLPGQAQNVFSNQVRNEPGQVAASAPFKPEICVEFLFGGEQSYPLYKKYRVQVNAEAITGRNWTVPFLATIQTARDLMSQALQFLCTKSGAPLTSLDYNVEYVFLDVNKAWHNKGE